MCAGDEPAMFPQQYSLFAGASEYSEPQHHSEELEQEMIDLITLQRLLSLAADDTPTKVRNMWSFNCMQYFLAIDSVTLASCQFPSVDSV